MKPLEDKLTSLTKEGNNVTLQSEDNVVFFKFWGI
jgi:hypothetical protein